MLAWWCLFLVWNEYVWTDLQWCPPDVTNRRSLYSEVHVHRGVPSTVRCHVQGEAKVRAMGEGCTQRSNGSCVMVTWDPTWIEWQKDTCENITFPLLHWRVVIAFMGLTIVSVCDKKNFSLVKLSFHQHEFPKLKGKCHINVFHPCWSVNHILILCSLKNRSNDNSSLSPHAHENLCGCIFSFSHEQQ